MKKLLFLIIAAGLFQFANAHEGHDKTPGTAAAPHGGLLQGTDSLFIEVLSTKEALKVYPLTHDMKAIPLNTIKITGTMSIPRKAGKPEALNFIASDDHLEAKVDAKGAHRYILNLDVTQGKIKEKLNFNVEPQ